MLGFIMCSPYYITSNNPILLVPPEIYQLLLQMDSKQSNGSHLSLSQENHLFLSASSSNFPSCSQKYLFFLDKSITDWRLVRVPFISYIGSLWSWHRHRRTPCNIENKHILRPSGEIKSTYSVELKFLKMQMECGGDVCCVGLCTLAQKPHSSSPTGTWGLETITLHLAFHGWVLWVQTRILTMAQQALFPLSHLPSLAPHFLRHGLKTFLIKHLQSYSSERTLCSFHVSILLSCASSLWGRVYVILSITLRSLKAASHSRQWQWHSEQHWETTVMPLHVQAPSPLS